MKQQRGSPSPKLTERNNEIYEKYQAGNTSMKKIAQEYGLDISRVSKIIKKIKEENVDNFQF